MNVLTDPAPNDRRTGPILTAVFLVVAMAVLPYVFLPGKQLYSDAEMAISRNEVVQEGSFSQLLDSDFWGISFDSGKSTGSYRPLVSATYALQATGEGGDPFRFHLVDLAIHGLAAVLVFFLLRRFFPKSRAVIPAALLFAAHPVLSDAVCSVTGRADMMAAAAMLGAMLLHLSARGSRRGWLLETGALACVAVALLCNERAVVFPLVLIGVDGAAWLAGRIPQEERKRVAVVAIAGIALVAVYLAVRFALLGHPIGTTAATAGDHPLYDASWTVRAASGASLLVGAARLVLIPVGLSYRYGWGTWPVAGGIGDPWALLGVALVVVAAVLAWRAARRKNDPVPGAALVLFVLPLLPVLNVIGLVPEHFAERFLYLPAVSLSLAVAWLLERVITRGAARLAGLVVVYAVAVVFAAATLLRVDDWASTEALARATLEVHPRSANALVDLGQEMLEQGDLEEAAEAFRRSLEVSDRRPEVWAMYATILQAQGEHGDAADGWRRVLDLSENRDWRVLAALGESELASGRPVQAAEALTEARREKPDSVNVESLLGLALLRAAQQKLQAGDLSGARTEIGKALELETLPAEGYFLAGLVFAHANDEREASRLFRRALEMDPELLKKKHDLAIRLAEQGRYPEAADLFREILVIDPEHVATLFNLGGLLAMSDRPESAIPFLEAGLRLVDDPRARSLLEEVRRRAAAGRR